MMTGMVVQRCDNRDWYPEQSGEHVTLQERKRHNNRRYVGQNIFHGWTVPEGREYLKKFIQPFTLIPVTWQQSQLEQRTCDAFYECICRSVYGAIVDECSRKKSPGTPCKRTHRKEPEKKLAPLVKCEIERNSPNCKRTKRLLHQLLGLRLQRLQPENGEAKRLIIKSHSLTERNVIYFFELSPFVERVFFGLNLVLEELLRFIEVFQQEQQYSDPPVPEGRNIPANFHSTFSFCLQAIRINVKPNNDVGERVIAFNV